jgi:hypothetical protein
MTSPKLESRVTASAVHSTLMAPMSKRCPEGGECRFSPDYEYDPSGAAVSCEKCGTSAEPPTDLELVFRQVEQAIDDHPRLTRVPGSAGEPQIVTSRLGITCRISVKLGGSSVRSIPIDGFGATAAAAALNLITRLDAWAHIMSIEINYRHRCSR